MKPPENIEILREQVEHARDVVAAQHGRRHVLVHILSMALLCGDVKSLTAAWMTYHTRKVTG